MNERAHERSRLTRWNGTWSLALVFGLASIPWTYAFVAGLHIPLWPSFIASATYYATDETGVEALKKGYATMFSVSGAGATAFGIAGLAGETLAALVAMLIGALIGIGTDELSATLT